MPDGKPVIMSFWLRFPTHQRDGYDIWHHQQMDRLSAFGLCAGGGAACGEKLDLPGVVRGSGGARCWMDVRRLGSRRLGDMAATAANWSGNDALSPQRGKCEAAAGASAGQGGFRCGWFCD